MISQAKQFEDERAKQLRCFRSNFLNLIILPTEACNFRCTYCYETFEHKKMKKEVVNGIKALIGRRGPELNKLEIAWFGGEPLLAFDVGVARTTMRERTAGKDCRKEIEPGTGRRAFCISRRRITTIIDIGNALSIRSQCSFPYQ
jgi:sulfatase maturation enzyme AslB (radical SAM superfamily)